MPAPLCMEQQEEAMAQQVTKSIIIKGDLHGVYSLWANFENFPRFMAPIRSIAKRSNTESHWVVDGPLGKRVEWDAGTTRLEADRRIAWSSVEGGDVMTSGQVTFVDLPRGEVQVTVTLRYQPENDLARPIFEALFGDLDGHLTQSLRQFKAYAEHGEQTPNRGAEEHTH